MQSYFSKEKLSYDGSQLSPLFAYKKWGVEGESLVAWVGSCNVSNENMKDGEDLFAGESIASDLMLHFIMELFEQPMFAMVLAQRLFTCIVKEELEELSGKRLLRSGDDLYLEDRKLSISIATRGAVSSMIHFALNITTEGTPVPTLSLSDLNISPEILVSRIFSKWEDEYRSVVRATKKIFPL